MIADADLDGCLDCEYHRDTPLFFLCKHPKSEYVIADKVDYHTCRHMREGLCGPERRLASFTRHPPSPLRHPTPPQTVD